MDKKIVTIGGGSGHYVLLSSFRNIRNISVSAVVSMADNGGSTGRLRKELGVLPPGDVLKCLLALSPEKEIGKRIFTTRFQSEKSLQNHNIGNLLLTFLTQYTNNFVAGINALGEILRIPNKHNILPVTMDKHTLVAELEDGERVFGETAIDLPRKTKKKRKAIKNIFLVPHYDERVKLYPASSQMIESADFIFITPGDIYTSIIPNLIVPGLIQKINQSKAKIVYFVNIMTKNGETNNWNLNKFLTTLNSYLKRPVDYCVVNNNKPNNQLLKAYETEDAHYIDPDNVDENAFKETQIFKIDLLEESNDLIRHDQNKLASFCQSIFFKQISSS